MADYRGEGVDGDHPRWRGLADTCECRAFHCAVGCVRAAEQTIGGEEASLDVCRSCAIAHRDEAVAVHEARR